MALVNRLRASLGEADRFYLAATNAEQRRTAILMALRDVLNFNRSVIPPIESLALSQHFEKFAELNIGSPDDTFAKSKGHGLTTSGEEQGRNALIAVAFKILTEGGSRKGNMTRELAGRFIATELNKRGLRDRGTRFTSSRVANIYLEVTRTPRRVKAGVSPTSVANAVTTAIRDMAKTLPLKMFTDQMKVISAWRAAGAKAGTPVTPFRTLDGRKAFVKSLLGRLPTTAFAVR